MDDLMAFDESSGGHPSARSSETLIKEIINLENLFDQLLKVCQNNLFKIPKNKVGVSATVDSLFNPAVNSTPVQQRDNGCGCGNMIDECCVAVQNNSANSLPAFDISKLGQSIEMNKMLFDVTNHVHEYLKRLMEKPFKEFEDACSMIKTQCQFTSRARQFGLDDHKNYPPRTFVRSFGGNSNSPSKTLLFSF